MKISVVTVCLNSERTIGNTIESFLRQTHTDAELLIVDGLSTDRTLSIVRSYNAPNIRIISEKDRGIYDAMNKGTRLFSGNALGYLNSDDAFHDNYALSRIADALQDADIAYGDVRMIKDHESKTVVREWRAGAYGRWSYHLGWMAPHSTFYMRREVVERVGLFDLNYTITADYDLMLRAMVLHQFRIRYIPHFLVDFKMGGFSTKSWKQTFHINMECLQSRRMHLRAPIVDAAFLLRPLRRVAQVRRLRNYLFRRS